MYAKSIHIDTQTKKTLYKLCLKIKTKWKIKIRQIVPNRKPRGIFLVFLKLESLNKPINSRGNLLLETVTNITQMLQ